MAQCGVSLIDAAAFVHPKWKPLLRDAEDVVRAVMADGDVTVPITALVPNPRGLARAVDAGLTDVSIWITGSEAFSQANLNMTTAQHAALNRDIATRALEAGLRLRGYVSAAVHCPFTGRVDPGPVARMVDELLDIGCYEIILCDTTGRASVRVLL